MAKNESFESHGFAAVTQQITQRLIIALSGLEKTGKSHFAFTAPGPIAYLSLDFGDEGVIQKFATKKPILKKEYKVPTIRRSKNRDDAMTEAEKVWEEFKDDYLFSLENCRTVIVDTETEVYELIRLAKFGKLEQVKSHHYGPVYRELKEVLIKAAYESDANVILLQRLKKAYANDKWTGEYEASGYSGIPFDVQVNCRTFIDNEGAFALYIDNCRQNATLRGQTITGPMLEFKYLAQLVLELGDVSGFE